jgi:adenylate kinase family enzyme
MTTFPQKIIKLLSTCRGILKKQLTALEWKAKITELGIKRTLLQQDNEITLYHKTLNVLNYLRSWLEQCSNRSAWYSGTEEFYEYLKEFLGEHRIENNKVININHQASRAMVEAIQLMNISPSSKHNFTTINRIDLCGKVIAHYGTTSQQQMFAKAIKDFQNNDTTFFVPLLENFDKYLKEFTTPRNKIKVH